MANRLATRADVCGPLGTPGGVAPALNDRTDDEVALALDQAQELVWVKSYRGLTHYAQAYLAAHLLATTPEPAPASQARERAAKAGVMAFADALADLRQHDAVAAVSSDRNRVSTSPASTLRRYFGHQMMW